jgi:phage tail-like protein
MHCEQPNRGTVIGSSTVIGASRPAAGAAKPKAKKPEDLLDGLRFDLQIDGLDLGSFISIEGLEASYEVKTYDEGGQNAFQHQLLGRAHYQNIKITRGVDGSSEKLAQWFTGFQREGTGQPTTATITAYDQNSNQVAAWHLQGVCPVHYSGPRFSAVDAKIPTETLELAHQGFGAKWPKS